MSTTWGPRGYPGAKGLTGAKGDVGDTGDTGQGVVVHDNNDGSYVIFGTNGYVTVYDGKTPIEGVDFFAGSSGDYVSFVYAKVPIGAPVPTIDVGTGNYNGTVETMPTGSVLWTNTPNSDVGFAVYTSTNRYIHDNTDGTPVGTWALKNDTWPIPVIYSINNLPQNQFISYAFTRNTTVPSIPLGGSYTSPNPTTVDWTDGIPPGTIPVYISKRLFTDDGLAPQDTQWSTPALLGGGGNGTSFKFGPTIDGPWNAIPNIQDIWMIVCLETASGLIVCDESHPIRIKGEDGNTIQTSLNAFAFKRSVDVLVEQPEGGDYSSPIPADSVGVSGWTPHIPAGNANLYVSTRLFTSDSGYPQENSWSYSQLFSGENAATFSITPDSYIFAFDSDGLNPTPTEIIFTAIKQNVETPTNWETVPPITFAANAADTDVFQITADEFGNNTSLKIKATSGTFSDEVIIIRVKDGALGTTGLPGEIREIRFEYTTDLNNVPNTTNWHSPLATGDVWMREGTFYDNVLTGGWSPAAKIVGDDGPNIYTEFWFSPTGNNNPDAATNDWTLAQQSNTAYIISRTFTNNIASAWSAVTYLRGNDGVAGKYFETRFIAASKITAPTHNTTPTLPNYNKSIAIPAGWVTNPNLAITPDSDEVIWAITTTKLADGTLDTDWTAPAVQWGAYTPRRGTDYSDGLGVYKTKVYKLATDGYNTPPVANTGSWNGTNEVLPDSPATDTGALTGWLDDPMSPTPGNYVYESSYLYLATIDANGDSVFGAAGAWSIPSKYAYIPTLGTDYNDGTDADGSFQSYIFKNSPIGTDLTTIPTGGSYNGAGTEVLPAGWTDDPVTPASDAITWISHRVYRKEGSVWVTPYTSWSIPSKFSALTSLTGVLDNPVATVNTDFNGNSIVYTGAAGGEFLVYFGNTPAVSTFKVVGGAYTNLLHTRTKNGLTLSIHVNTGIYSVSGANWSTDSESFIMSAEHTASGTIVNRRYTVSKIKDGATGESGTANRIDIAYADDINGLNADYPPITTTGKQFIGTNTVTWIPPNAEPAVSITATDYEWTKITGDDGANGLSSKVNFAYADSIDVGGVGTGNVQYATNIAAATPLTTSKYLGTDVVTWLSTNSPPLPSTTATDYEWSQYTGDDGIDGDDGVSPLCISLSNPNHSIPVDSSGNNPDYTHSGTIIIIMEGVTNVIYDGVGALAGTWKIASAIGTDITAGAITDTGDVATVANATGLTGGNPPLTAKIDYTITGFTAATTTNPNGVAFSLLAQQSFTKSLSGIGGSVIQNSDNNTIQTVSVTHASQGGTIKITWNCRMSANGTNPPSAQTYVNLLRNGVIIDTVKITYLEEIYEVNPTINIWFMNLSTQLYIDAPSTTNNVVYTMSLTGTGTYDTVFASKNKAMILTEEFL